MENFHSYSFKQPLGRRDREELGPGKKSLVFCSECSVVYYQKAWHHNADHFKSLVKEHKKEKDHSVKFVLCPACQMVKNHQYEGRIVLENVPVKVTTDLENLIQNFCQKAQDRDPLDRLIAVNKKKNMLEVTLTENQLANRLAHKIKETFHNTKIHTTYAGNPSDVVEIKIAFS